MPENTKEESYTIKIVGKGVNVDQTISRGEILRVLNVIMGGGDSGKNSLGIKDIAESSEPTITTGQTVDPKTFMAAKRSMSDVERITCLAYYLSRYRGATQYKTRELTDLNTEAFQPRFSNPAVAARNAVTQQYLSLAGGGRKQITTRGEAVVRALPDREKVKKALEENIYRSRLRQASKTKKVKEPNN